MLLGVTHDDGPAQVDWMARKIWGLRILRDEQSASDVGAPILVVSQFTLYGDARKGRRPTWNAAAPGAGVGAGLRAGLRGARGARARRCRAASFGADMQVELVNDGPVTLVLDTDRVTQEAVRSLVVSSRAVDW